MSERSLRKLGKRVDQTFFHTELLTELKYRDCTREKGQKYSLYVPFCQEAKEEKEGTAVNNVNIS